ncbi:hypothetical protein BGLA2_790006 [Burkholderia gladioli]|nr:hypothetical protein BGLA2_790006 [Burkholderia gladioli]
MATKKLPISNQILASRRQAPDRARGRHLLACDFSRHRLSLHPSMSHLKMNRNGDTA